MRRVNTSPNKIDIDAIKSFEEMLALLNTFHIRISADSFTFINTKMKDGKVAVRFVGSQGISVDYHRRHMQLGLWLVPTAAFKDQFLKQTKFILGDFKNGLTDQVPVKRD